MRRKLLLGFAAAGLIIGLGWQGVAIAHNAPGVYGPHGPVITTNTSIVHPGDFITVSCKNFASHEKIVFTIHSDRSDLGTTNSSRDGSCSIRVKIPGDIKQGEHTIVADGRSGDSASTQIFVEFSHNRDRDGSRYH